MRKKISKNTLKYSCYVGLTSALLLSTLFSVACSSGDNKSSVSVSYGPEIGIAKGSVDLSGEEPVINISDIKAEVGMNIDYLSSVVVENEDSFPDLEVWVDASMVDIFTPGDYKAVYTFVYGGKSVSKDITVTLVQSEQSASDIISNESVSDDVAGGNDVTQNTTLSADNNIDSGNSSNNSGNNNSASANTNTTKPVTVTTKSTTKTNSTTTKANTSTTKANVSTTKATTTKANTTTKKTTRQIITTKSNVTTASQSIGNYTIELLSGKSITIKNTTARYIVSTRTDVSTYEKNNKTYRVSKLIITFNTGAEQVLETLEERIK